MSVLRTHASSLQPLVPRAAARRLDALLRAMPVVIVTGPRQVGKSSLVRNTPSLAGHRLIDLDDANSRLAAERDPDDLVRRWPKVVIDEVQRAPSCCWRSKGPQSPSGMRRKGESCSRAPQTCSPCAT